MEGRKMHYRYTLILLFAWFGAIGQTTVPNTNTFKLSDVTAVVGGNNLVTAFTNSVDAYFDPTYKGSKNQLYNFRNYKKSDVAVTSQSATATGSSSASVTFDISSTNYDLTDWAILCYTSGFSYVGRLDGSASGTSQSVSESYTGLNPSSTYLFQCFGVDASGNAAAEWTNEITTSGCTRPGGLTAGSFVYSVGGVTVTSGNVCDVWAACGTCLDITVQSTYAEGADVYAGTGSDCTKASDGYYLVWVPTEGGYWVPVQISGGKLYYVAC